MTPGNLIMNTLIKDDNKKADKMNLNLDEISLLEGAGVAIGALLTIILGFAKSQFNRLRGRVDTIEANYVKDEKYEKLEEKFDTRTKEITEIFREEHGKTQSMLVDLAGKIGDRRE